jgi:dienelactone hydrolase
MLKLFTLPALAALATAVLVPPPSGPYAVVSGVHDLTDESRQDPYSPEDKRRILVSTYFPVDSSSCEDEDVVIPYLPPQTEIVFGQFIETSFGVPGQLIAGFEVAYCSPKEAPTSEENEGGDGFPLVIFSPGFGGTRLFYSVQAAALASLGYAVITVDHPYDALVTEFPDGTLIPGPAVEEGDEAGIVNLVKVRAQDISFLIDQLEQSPSLGSNIPIDMSNIISIGHSLGGWTSAGVAINDDRVLGGINFDGRIGEPVASAGLAKPFLLVGVATALNETHQGWSSFYESVSDAKMILGVNGTLHSTYTDLSYLVTLVDIPPQLIPALQAALGTIDGTLNLEILTSIVDGFADLVFKGDTAPLKGIDEEYEDVVTLAEKLPGSCDKA